MPNWPTFFSVAKTFFQVVEEEVTVMIWKKEMHETWN
jgi:hypothetical protein